MLNCIAFKFKGCTCDRGNDWLNFFPDKMSDGEEEESEKDKNGQEVKHYIYWGQSSDIWSKSFVFCRLYDHSWELFPQEIWVTSVVLLTT